MWIEPEFFRDERGRFRRTFCPKLLNSAGIPFEVKQCNLSENLQAGTLRGFHFQRSEEVKLLTCVTGGVYDILVDIRQGSATFGKWKAFRLSAENGGTLLVPAGCANAWMTLKDSTSIHYWHSDIYRPELEAGIRYNDPGFGFEWPEDPVVISEKDRSYPNYPMPDL